MQNNPIGWVEIPVTDLDRAEQFYKNFFGVSCERQPELNGHIMSWFPMDMKGYGSAATLMYGPNYTPSKDGALIYFTAPEETIDASLEKASILGITILMPKVSIGEHGFMACIQDSEGNRIAIHSMKG